MKAHHNRLLDALAEPPYRQLQVLIEIDSIKTLNYYGIGITD